jgi:uncharacterized protein YndB with AHSA1/START domain
MKATQFDLVAQWRFDAPRERIWAILETPEEWPSWWRAIEKVDVLTPGDADGVGAVRRLTWKTALPYSLSFDMRVTKIEPMSRIEAEASGELDGTGIWTLQDDGGGTSVRYDWQVRVTKPWMRAMAPLLKPVFAWNHGVVMEWGRQGMLQRLSN